MLARVSLTTAAPPPQAAAAVPQPKPPAAWLGWVGPLLMGLHSDRDATLAEAEQQLIARDIMKPGDVYAITCGEPMGEPGGTNMLKICRAK